MIFTDWILRPRKTLMGAVFLFTIGGAVCLAQNVPFTSRFSTTTNGAIFLTGNALETCLSTEGNCTTAVNESVTGTSNNNGRTMVFVDVDTNPSTFNSSSAALGLPPGTTVLFAALTWGGFANAPSSGPDPRTQVLLATPASSAYIPITGSISGSGLLGGYTATGYFGFADVTAQVQAGGNGTYTVANVQSATGVNSGGFAAGWSLAVVYRDSTQPLRNLVVFNGFGTLTSSSPPVTSSISGFVVPPTGPTVAKLGVVGLEGDRGITGDSILLNGKAVSDSLNAANNVMNSTISYLGSYISAKNPNFTNQLGWDAKTIEADNLLPNGATSTTVTMQTAGDAYQIGMFTLSVDIFAPTLTSTKTVIDLTNPGGPVAAGDTLQFTVSVTETGVDTAAQTVLLDPIPANTTYVPGSLVIVSGPGPNGAQTDVPGDDAAEFDTAASAVRFRLGTGANATTGGRLAQGQTSTVQFNVTAVGTSFTNVATTNATGLTSGQPVATTASVMIPSPSLSIAKSHSGSFTEGQTGMYSIVVTNGPLAGPTFGTVTVTDTLPAGLIATDAAGPGWTCLAPTTCTRSDVLSPGASYPPITLTVSVAPNAPPSVVNAASVSGGGAPSPATVSDTTSITPVPAPDLSVAKTHTGSFTAGQTGTYSVVVSNAAGSGPTAGAVNVSDTLPAGLTGVAATGAGWTCTISDTVDCTRSDVLAAGASYPPITITVGVGAGVLGTVTNSVTVSGGGDITPANDSASDATNIVVPPPPAPSLLITKSHVGTFTAGQTGAYNIVVSNAPSAGPTVGTVTVTDTPSPGLTVASASGAGWTCTVGATAVCTRGDALPGGSSYPPIALTVNIATNVPASVGNTATVAGGGSSSASASDVAPVTPVPASAPSLSLAKSHAGNFTAGQTGAYNIVVSNAPSGGPTSSTVTVSDSLPSGLTATAATGSGWTCSVGAMTTCTRSDVLAPGGSYPPITLAVNVAASASGSVTNNATVAGGGSAAPVSASDPTAITPSNVPDLSIVISHNGSFTAGETGAQYSIVASNAASGGPTAGTVTVSDMLPAGLTATAATGPGWTCTVGATVTCTRNDALAPGASYPPITLVVDIAANAPKTIVNTVTVSGGGDVTPTNDTAYDSATLAAPMPFSVNVTPEPNFGSGPTGVFTSIVSNNSTTASSGETVLISTISPPAVPVSASGTGWTCSVVAQSATCSREDVLAPGSQFPPVSVTAKITAVPPGGTVTDTAQLSIGSFSCGGGATVTLPAIRSANTPVITLVTNAASFVTPGQVNYGIAPGSLITIFGTGIGPAAPASLDALPLTPSGFAGVHVQVTVGGATLDVPVFFAADTQLNALLPSNTPLGDGTMTVTFNGVASPPYAARILKTGVGLFGRNKQGFGPGVEQGAAGPSQLVTDTLLAPVHPGEIVILWATGLGAVQGNEFAQPLPGDLGIPTEIYVGGQIVTPLYAGRSGCCAGTDQIQFVFPDNVAGCYVPVLVKAGGLVSNTVTVSAASQDGTCNDPGGLTQTDLTQLSSGGSLISATISLNRSILPGQPAANRDFALATFRALTLPPDLSAELEFAVPAVGSCTAGQSRRDGQGQTPAAPDYVPADAASIFPLREKIPTYLNAGSLEIVRGTSAQPMDADSFTRYSALLGPPNESSSTFFDPGTVTVFNAQAPAPIGLFSQLVTLPAPPQVVGAQQGPANVLAGTPPVVDRTKSLRVQWSGGDATDDLAVIAGFKTVTSLGGGFQGVTATGWFVCIAPINSGSFTVPADVMLGMPTGLPVTGQGTGQQLPWIPGASLSDPTKQKSSLAIGSIRKPDQSSFTIPGIGISRLFYVLTNRLDLDYR